jgi:predicted Zn-dependent peptidase
MRYLLLILIFITTLFSSNPYKNITSYTLKNGLKVYLYPNDKAENTAINVDVKVGMKAEDEDSAGLSHLVEHIVFRDGRIEDRDYLDLFKKEGASFVNAYTKYYKTQYLTTIKSDKAYWIVEQFAQMLLDKNVTKEDLEAERGALQVEIGEYTWVDRVAPDIQNIFDKIEDIFPPQPDFYKDEFGIDIEEEQKRKYYSSFTYRANNQNFTLQKVMNHYNNYYYPSNMTLNVVGNFNLKKMKETIEKSFGKFAKRDGKSVDKKIYKVAKLNHKPYKKYGVGLDKNIATIGTKFISDDPKKVIILQSYVQDLADRLNKVFRNQNGESYGTQGRYSHYHDGGIATVAFNTQHNSFDKNILYAKNLLKKEQTGALTEEVINEALKTSKKLYDSQEHDSHSLMNLIQDYQNFQKAFDTNSSPYDILLSIAPDEFKTTVEQSFVPQNSYQYILRDYHFFAHEVAIFFALLSLLMFYLIYRFYGTKIHKQIIMKRRLTSGFVSFFIILLSLVIASIVTEWVFYFTMSMLPISNMWASGYDTPISYIIYFVDFLISIIVLYLVIKKLFKWFYIKLYATNNTLIFSGSNTKYIKMTDIKELKVIRWTPAHFGKVHGVSLLFWKPILKITSHQSDAVYIRAKNAKELKSDLEFAIFYEDRREGR